MVLHPCSPHLTARAGVVARLEGFSRELPHRSSRGLGNISTQKSAKRVSDITWSGDLSREVLRICCCV